MSRIQTLQRQSASTPWNPSEGFHVTGEPRTTRQVFIESTESLAPVISTVYSVVVEDISTLYEELAELRLSLESLKIDMQMLIESQAFVTYLTSLGDRQVTLKRPIPVTIRRDEDEFIVSFFDAGISTGGVNEQDAISSLQSLIVDCFEMHEDENDEEFGPVMQQQ